MIGAYLKLYISRSAMFQNAYIVHIDVSVVPIFDSENIKYMEKQIQTGVVIPGSVWGIKIHTDPYFI